MSKKPVYRGQTPKGVLSAFGGPKRVRPVRVTPMLQKRNGR